MNPLKKRQKLDDEQLETYCKELDDLQDKLDVIDKEERDKVIQLSVEYNKQRKPHFDKRNELVSKIPDFWLTAFKHHPVLGSMLSEEDEEIFKYLSTMEVVEADDVKSGYKITLTFNKNPYFNNSTLFKEFIYNEEGELKINGSQIQWKEGKNPLAQEENKKGSKRTAPEDSLALSFFAWFGDEEEDQELAEEIKENFWPNLVGYYHNVVDTLVEYEDDDEDDDDEEGEEEEGEEDVEEDEEK